jgi:hypothetical protein
MINLTSQKSLFLGLFWVIFGFYRAHSRGKNCALFPAAVWLAVETTLQQEPTMHSVFEE